MILINNIKNFISKVKKTGFSEIFLSNIIKQCVTLIGGFILVRMFTKEDYGEYSYVMNCYAILSILGDFGVRSAMQQFCNEEYDNQKKFNSYFIYGVIYSFIYTSITCVIVILSPVFFPYSSLLSQTLTLALALLPLLVNINYIILLNLRIKLKNKKYAIINIMHTLVHYIVILSFSYFFGVVGAVLSGYIINILVIFFGYSVSKKEFNYSKKDVVLTKKEKKEFNKFAYASQLNNMIYLLLIYVDVFIIGLIYTNVETIATYKVASTIPSALVFIPNSVILFIMPYLARNKNNFNWIKKYYNKLLLFGFLSNFVIVIIAMILSEPLIVFLYGEQYIDAVYIFCVLMIAYFFNATFRLPSVNLIYTQRKVKINAIFTICLGILNIVLNFIFINWFGYVGVAYSTVLVNVVGSILSYLYIKTKILNKTNSL